MTADLTPKALDALAGLDQAATPGPWEQRGQDVEHHFPEIGEAGSVATAYEADAALIAAMRNALPALIAAARDRKHWQDHAEEAGQGFARVCEDYARVSARNVALVDERDALARWKAEALPVMAGLQELGRALDVRLGESITARESVDKALDLRNERDAARAQVAAVEALCRNAVLGINNVGVSVAHLEAALADPTAVLG